MQNCPAISEVEYLQHKTLKEMLAFTRYHFKKRHGRGFVVGDHHITIANALDRVLTGKLKRLIINIAPRYGKTELAVKNFMAKGLAQNPKARFIHLSYSDDLALDNSEDVRDFVQSEEYQELYPNVQIKQDSKAKKKWYTTEGGGVYATSAAGQVTGFGAGQVDEEIDDEDAELSEFMDGLDQNCNDIDALFSFGGAIVIDDPIKPEDADSDNQRERVNQRFDSTIRNRVNSRNTPIIIIMQRLHPMDLCGYLIDLEPEEWEVISLPCIYEVDKVEHPLWPFKHTLEELHKLKKINEIVFAKQYMQDPKPTEGLLFPIEQLRFYNPADLKMDGIEYKMAFADPADKGGDFFAFVMGLVIGEYVYIHDIVFNKDGVDVVFGAVTEQIVKYRANELIVEGNGGWHLAGKQLRQMLGERARDCRTMIINATAQKETRILAQSSFIKNHFMFRSDWKDIPEYKTLLQNVTGYLKEGKNKNDDAPDCLAGLAHMLQRNIPHHFKT